MVELTYMMSTAREDFPFASSPDLHLFEPNVRSLMTQTSKDFEFVVVDAFKDQRPDWFEERGVDFPVVHVKPKPGSWLERGRWGLCAGYNTGLAYSSGKYVVTMGDSFELPDHATAVLLEHLREGRRPQMVFVFYRGDRPVLAPLNASPIPSGNDVQSHGPIDDGVLVDLPPDISRKDRLAAHLSCDVKRLVADHRYRILMEMSSKSMVYRHEHGEWFYGYSAYTMEDALELNGYDEKLDGCRSLEDCDFGMRLNALMGGQPSFVLDRRLWVIEHHHTVLNKTVLPRESRPFKANFPVLRRNQYSGEHRANTRRFNADDEKWFKTLPTGQDSTFSKDWEAFRWDDPDFRIWWDEAPVFDLREQRKRLAAGLDPWG